jgi:GT2 family glycosyltransferase
VTETIHILLPVHNRREITRLFIECLKAQTVQNYHLVLIDDGSTDGTEEMVRAAIDNLTVLKGTGDWWWGGSLQQGYNWLKGRNLPLTDLVLIINDDTTFETDFLEKGLALLSRHDRTLLTAQCYSKQDGRLVDAGVHIDLTRLRFAQASAPEEINCLSTRGLFVRLADFFAVGGFRPRLLPHYLSDYEFTIRAHRRGMKLLTDPALRLWVDEQASGYHNVESEPFLQFFRKCFSIRYPANPLTLSVFALLVSPLPWNLVNVLRVWKSASVVLWRCLIRSHRI